MIQDPSRGGLLGTTAFARLHTEITHRQKYCGTMHQSVAKVNFLSDLTDFICCDVIVFQDPLNSGLFAPF